MFEMADVSRAPQSLTSHEREALISAALSGRNAARNGTILWVAVGTGLREHEIVALNVGDAVGPAGVRQRIPLAVFKGHKRLRGGQPVARQEVLVPAGVRDTLAHWIERRRLEGACDTDPLFVGERGDRLTTRGVRHMFASLQRRAGLERRFTFHHLRHTFCTDLYVLTQDLRVVQRAARHARVATTVVYTHPPDERLLGAVEGLDAARRATPTEKLSTGPNVTADMTGHFPDRPPFTFQKLAHSESAVGTPEGVFQSHENPTTPRPAPRPPAPARVRSRRRRPSARAAVAAR